MVLETLVYDCLSCIRLVFMMTMFSDCLLEMIVWEQAKLNFLASDGDIANIALPACSVLIQNGVSIRPAFSSPWLAVLMICFESLSSRTEVVLTLPRVATRCVETAVQLPFDSDLTNVGLCVSSSGMIVACRSLDSRPFAHSVSCSLVCMCAPLENWVAS